MLSYDGRIYAWNKGRLSGIYKVASKRLGSLSEDCRFTYDAYGRRVAKNYTYDPNPGATNDSSHTYRTTYNYDNSGRLIREYTVENYSSGTTTTREFVFLYNESGIIGVMYGYDGAALQPYYFHKNLQGDVVAIYDANGSIKAEYAYDAYGNCKVTNSTLSDLAQNNPIRYRGYYLDRETGLYFLNTRYYNPEWRRFISPDSTDYLDPESVNGLNLYVYCGNDPVNYSDPTGHFAISIFWACVIGGLIAGAIIGGTASGIVAYNLAAETGSTSWELAGWTILGVLGGAVVGGAVGAGLGAVGGELLTGVATLGGAIGSGGIFALAGGGTFSGASAMATVSVGTSIGVGAEIGVLGAGIVFMSKPNSGRIRFSDGTGINPSTGKEFANPKEATDYYKTLKDNVQKAKLKKWMKGKGWRNSHLKGLVFLPLAGEWFRRLVTGEW